MSVNSIFRQGVELKIFRSKLTECPAALSMVMAVASDMVLTKGLMRTPWSNRSEVIVTSDGESVVGFVVYQKGYGVQIEFAWVEPGLRGEGIFDDMFSLLRALFFNEHANAMSVVEGFMTDEMRAALTRNGFHGSDYLPFRADWSGPVLKNPPNLLSNNIA